MNPPAANSPQSNDPPPGPDLTVAAQQSQRGFIWFFAILALNVVSLLWLSVRAGSPSSVAVVLDFFFHSAIGGAVIFFAFRMVFWYPFRFTDLLTIVLILSLGLRVILNLLFELSRLGVVGDLFAPRGAGNLVQACLLCGSVLLAGAAMGLRHCHILKIDKPVARALTVASGMVALPAMAGVATFPVLILRDVLYPKSSSHETHILALHWIGSIAASIVNAVCFVRTLSLKSVIDAQEKLPGAKPSPPPR